MGKVAEVTVELTAAADEVRFHELMAAHHYLGGVRPRGKVLRYVARHGAEWVALAVFQAAALKCGARDRWIGWERTVQYGRLYLISNNARFLLLPGAPKNLGSRVLGQCVRRLRRDWPRQFGHELLLLETFVDPSRFRGTVYRAANWLEVGETRGYARIGAGYEARGGPKRVFVLPLRRRARERMRAAELEPGLQKGVAKLLPSAAQMQALPKYFVELDDPRRSQGRRHWLPAVLSLSVVAALRGARGYKGIHQRIHRLGPQVVRYCGVRRRGGEYRLPSCTVVRSVLRRVDSRRLDAALERWRADHFGADAVLPVDSRVLGCADEGRTP